MAFYKAYGFYLKQVVKDPRLVTSGTQTYRADPNYTLRNAESWGSFMANSKYLIKISQLDCKSFKIFDLWLWLIYSLIKILWWLFSAATDFTNFIFENGPPANVGSKEGCICNFLKQGLMRGNDADNQDDDLDYCKCFTSLAHLKPVDANLCRVWNIAYDLFTF